MCFTCDTTCQHLSAVQQVPGIMRRPKKPWTARCLLSSRPSPLCLRDHMVPNTRSIGPLVCLALSRLQSPYRSLVSLEILECGYTQRGAHRGKSRYANSKFSVRPLPKKLVRIGADFTTNILLYEAPWL